MELLEKIEDFVADIYFKLPQELNNDFVNICEKISAYFEMNFMDNIEVINQSKDTIKFLFSIFQTGDYIKMADAFNYEVKPIIQEANNISKLR